MRSVRRRIGLYGGSFDPIHHGHLILAREAREVLGLDEVVFIPAGVSPHKLHAPPAPAEIRAAMVKAAIDGEAGFSWSDIEVRRPGPSFAIETVRHFATGSPGAEIFYFIGSDNLEALHTWKEIDALRRAAQFVVLARGGDCDVNDFPCIRRVVDISSTDIRNRVAAGRSVKYLVPDTVCALIALHGLYRNE